MPAQVNYLKDSDLQKPFEVRTGTAFPQARCADLGHFPKWSRNLQGMRKGDQPSPLGEREPCRAWVHSPSHDKTIQKLPNGARCGADNVGDHHLAHRLGTFIKANVGKADIGCFLKTHYSRRLAPRY